ncbi:MAG TPA: hypothetical protein VKA15_21840, partial [Isosphaeraceae bacterium]|nr:hypothetical protein [Isosphaeraceae bacterium]
RQERPSCRVGIAPTEDQHLTRFTVHRYGVPGARNPGTRRKNQVWCPRNPNMFSVRAVTGPYRGQTLCHRCKLGNSPVVCVFARRITAPLTSLFKQLDARIAHGDDRLKALVVFS